MSEFKVKTFLGASNKDLSYTVGGSLEISCTEIFNRGVETVIVKGYSHVDSYLSIHRRFWKDEA